MSFGCVQCRAVLESSAVNSARRAQLCRREAQSDDFKFEISNCGSAALGLGHDLEAADCVGRLLGEMKTEQSCRG